MAEPIEVCGVDTVRWRLYNLVRDCGWVNDTSPDTIQNAVQCAVGARVPSKAERDFVLVEKRIGCCTGTAH